MSEMFKPVFIPNFIPEKNNRNNNNEEIFYEQVLYERIREKEEDISKNVEDTKQLFDDLDKEETQEIVRNKIFIKVKNTSKITKSIKDDSNKKNDITNKEQ